MCLFGKWDDDDDGDDNGEVFWLGRCVDLMSEYMKEFRSSVWYGGGVVLSLSFYFLGWIGEKRFEGVGRLLGWGFSYGTSIFIGFLFKVFV